MSGTDRYEVFRGQCYCGSGEIIIKHCEPDHSYVRDSQGWFEATMSCENCRAKYELVEQEGNFVIVNKSDTMAQKELCSEWHKRCDNLMVWPEVQELLKELEIILNSQQSMAARYRLLRKYFMVLESIATFRKHWHSSLGWIKRNVRASNLDNVINLLNTNNEKISQELLELKKLQRKCHKPLPIVGNPIYNTSPQQVY